MKEFALTGIHQMDSTRYCKCNGKDKEEQYCFMSLAPMYFLFELKNSNNVILGQDSPLSDLIAVDGIHYKLTGVIASPKVGEFVTYAERGGVWHGFNGEAVFAIDMGLSNEVGTAVMALYTRVYT